MPARPALADHHPEKRIPPSSEQGSRRATGWQRSACGNVSRGTFPSETVGEGREPWCGRWVEPLRDPGRTPQMAIVHHGWRTASSRHTYDAEAGGSMSGHVRGEWAVGLVGWGCVRRKLWLSAAEHTPPAGLRRITLLGWPLFSPISTSRRSDVGAANVARSNSEKRCASRSAPEQRPCPSMNAGLSGKEPQGTGPRRPSHSFATEETERGLSCVQTATAIGCRTSALAPSSESTRFSMR